MLLIQSTMHDGNMMHHGCRSKTLSLCWDLQNANLTDVLMDRAVLNEANLKNANMQRTIFTRCLPLCMHFCKSDQIRKICFVGFWCLFVFPIGLQLQAMSSGRTPPSIQSCKAV